MTKALKNLIVKEARKATGAFVVTLAGAGGTAMLDGTLTGAEMVVSAGTALVATATVYGFTNKPKA